MTSRRRFLGSLVSASAALPTVPALTNDALAHLARTVSAVAGRPPAAVADDEDFWREIQDAFTLDRTLINLNNGGVSPSPRSVQDAMERYLAISNTAPVVTMWQWLEPEDRGGAAAARGRFRLRPRGDGDHAQRL